MSQTHPKSLALAIGAAVAAGSLFSMQAMAHGYMQQAQTAEKAADAKAAEGKAAEGKATEGKCGEGKCGAGMMAGADKPAAAKADHEGGCGMRKMDTDKDGRISRAEFAAAHAGKDEMFAGIDADKDGFVSQAEMDAHHAAMKKDGKAGEGKCGEGKCGEGKCGGGM